MVETKYSYILVEVQGNCYNALHNGISAAKDEMDKKAKDFSE